MDWKVEKKTGVCASCLRAFAPGDGHYSAVFGEEVGYLRRDYCEVCWEARGKGEELCFWKTLVPRPEDRRKARYVDDSVMLHLFNDLAGKEDARDVRFRFVLALMLARRKVFRMGSVEEGVVVFDERKARRSHRVKDPWLKEDEIDALREEVQKLFAGEA